MDGNESVSGSDPGRASRGGVPSVNWRSLPGLGSQAFYYVRGSGIVYLGSVCPEHTTVGREGGKHQHHEDPHD